MLAHFIMSCACKIASIHSGHQIRIICCCGSNFINNAVCFLVSVFVLDLLCTKYRGRQHCVGNGIGLRVGNAYNGNGNAWSESLAPLLIQITQYILKRFRLYMRNYQNSIIQFNYYKKIHVYTKHNIITINNRY